MTDRIATRKIVRSLKFVVAMAICIAIAYAMFGHRVEKPLCEYRDGKWASTTDTCITRSCYKDGSCGSWANTVSRCDRLTLGVPRSEVYFQLGMPETANPDSATWFAAKQSAEIITAHFESDHLASLSCLP